jgi:microcystin-dependent protein
MSTPYLGEIKIVSFNFAPKGWAFCNGQLLPINQNQALFSILGTTYGGDGRVNFALPNLQTRAPVHVGNSIALGQQGGEQAHTLSIAELPTHTHPPGAFNGDPNVGSPAGALWCKNNNLYSTSANTSLLPASVANVGGSQAHANLQPYLVLNFVIALQGIFPSPN